MLVAEKETHDEGYEVDGVDYERVLDAYRSECRWPTARAGTQGLRAAHDCRAQSL